MEKEMLEDNFDPQWEAAIRGDREALCLELQTMAETVDALDTHLHALMRQIHDLRSGLQSDPPTSTYKSSVAGDIGTGSLRASPSTRDQRDHSTPPF
jgi:hypothetical protein